MDFKWEGPGRAHPRNLAKLQEILPFPVGLGESCNANLGAEDRAGVENSGVAVSAQGDLEKSAVCRAVAGMAARPWNLSG